MKILLFVISLIAVFGSTAYGFYRDKHNIPMSPPDAWFMGAVVGMICGICIAYA